MPICARGETEKLKNIPCPGKEDFSPEGGMELRIKCGNIALFRRLIFLFCMSTQDIFLLIKFKTYLFSIERNNNNNNNKTGPNLKFVQGLFLGPCSRNVL